MVCKNWERNKRGRSNFDILRQWVSPYSANMCVVNNTKLNFRFLIIQIITVITDV